MSNNRVLLGVAAVVVSLVAAGVARAGDDAPAARAGNGMRIDLDEHGRPIVPPPDAPPEQAPPQVPARRALRPVPEPAPGGGEMIHNDRFDYSVGRVGKDGRLTVDCLHRRPGGTGSADE